MGVGYQVIEPIAAGSVRLLIDHADGRPESSRALLGLGLAFGGAAGKLVDIVTRRQIVASWT
jgi:hypothetical protein